MKQNNNFDFSQGISSEDDSFGYLYFIYFMYREFHILLKYANIRF